MFHSELYLSEHPNRRHRAAFLNSRPVVPSGSSIVRVAGLHCTDISGKYHGQQTVYLQRGLTDRGLLITWGQFYFLS